MMDDDAQKRLREYQELLGVAALCPYEGCGRASADLTIRHGEYCWGHQPLMHTVDALIARVWDEGLPRVPIGY